MSANGRLPRSELAPIHFSGPGHLLLAREPAAAWNSMNLHLASHGGVVSPGGPDSAYRDYAGQVYWRNYWCGLGQCGNAATPGTSSHGEGLTVDDPSTAEQARINRYGAPFGYQKAWSDASWEPWHFRYATGHWRRRPDPGPLAAFPRLERGSGGPGQRERVRECQVLLRRCGHRVKVTGVLDGRTERALQNFQKRVGLKPTGTTNIKTWRRLHGQARKKKRRRRRRRGDH